MFCQRMRLMLWLRRVPARWINIWKDPAAAEFVRSVANGNETVPTVIIAFTLMIAAALSHLN